jgi:ABC-type taurine transport system substrate-binding protein
MAMYVTIEMNVVNNAIDRSWAEFDVSRPASAAAALAAVEESAFVIGSSSVRALQSRCVMVAVWFMNRCVNDSRILPRNTEFL